MISVVFLMGDSYHPDHIPSIQQVGFDVCVKEIDSMVTEAKKNAGIDPSQPLEALVSRMLYCVSTMCT